MKSLFNDLPCIAMVVISVYVIISISAFGIGFLDATDNDGFCQKSPTILGKYIGTSFTLKLGCKLGQRIEE